MGVLNDQDDYTKNRNYWKYLKTKLKKEENGGCVKTLLFLKNHKALTFTSQGFAMSKSCCNFRP